MFKTAFNLEAVLVNSVFGRPTEGSSFEQEQTE
jgi:hypothetical protein